MATRKNGLLHIVVRTAIACLATIGLWYFTTPALNIHSIGTWIFGIITAIAIIVVTALYKDRKQYQLYDIRMIYNPNEKPQNSGEEKLKIAYERTEKIIEVTGKIERVCIIITTVACLAIPIGSFLSGRIINADRYRNLATVTEGNFEQDFPEVDASGSNIPFVSMEIAQQLGDRTIANVEGAEYYEVDDEYNLIEFQGDYYRISSLSYGKGFKHISASKNGIPGYVLVNARTQEAKFCKVEGGYFYSPSSWFNSNLKRHIRLQYPSEIFDFKSYFEIDEEGRPYWITPCLSRKIGLFGGDKVEHVIITDACNGNSQRYDIETLPSWVDHAMLLSYLKEKATDYYELVHGKFNFSDTDVKKLSSDYNSFVNEKGEVCFTMGLSPANEAKSNIGFILINSRTGEIKQYIADGIQETTAQARAEALVQNYGYIATFPQVINIEGNPTYLMCLKGSDGLIQYVALARISTKSSATVYAPTLKEAIEKYKNSLAGETDETSERLEVEGAIEKIYTAEIEGTTYFFYVLEDNEEKLYKASISLNERQILLVEGDKVKISYSHDSDIIHATAIDIG